LKYIAQEGFKVTAKDLYALLEEASDEELDQIAGAGGRCMGHSCWW
jgi:hypothetical protein